MLEVNDFNAIRISLASPEDIKSWSYGEVTKPETINYRTLRPEKDGLFCEKIFGPTKDWECYCGKYKRIRYKGIICDKCGVEVTRSKVRRERMGHIQLAAPVSHIWFVKSTPSRLGLLLDKSPRELEKVIYFASYIVTEVNQEVKEKLLVQLEEEYRSSLVQLEEAAGEQGAQIQQGANMRIEELTRQIEAEEEALKDEIETSKARTLEEAAPLKVLLESSIGEEAKEPVALEGVILVEAETIVAEEAIKSLEERVQSKISELEARLRKEQQDRALLLEAEIDHLRSTAGEEVTATLQTAEEKKPQMKEEYENKRRQLEELQPLKLLTQSQEQELREKYSSYGLFKAGMGAEAIREILVKWDLNALREQLRAEIIASSGSAQRRKKAARRLRVAEAFHRSGNRPEWMNFSALPVLPPDLRPMVQLDGGRFATSDLNDLYRLVINRNNRLKRLIALDAPQMIIRNEKRMLQEAVDSLIDNGRRGRAVASSANHKLKSLSDMLKGKQGRFRQNLLGKRVDYSGRSVIVVGPELKLHQCGLPKRMALELFKPFVMRRLVERNFAHNIKSAKRIVDRVRPEVWDALEEVIQDHPVLLNRAPTLHRLGIQAFQPVLVEGSAIRIHPLVCAAFGADFDGDQMAVHVPLSNAAIAEAKTRMLSIYNILLPSSGEPIVAPTLDMVLGCYYLTVIRPGAKGEGKVLSSLEEAHLAYDLGIVDLQAQIKVMMPTGEGEDGEARPVTTSMGRLIFNEILPPQLRYRNEVMDKKSLKNLIAESYRRFGVEVTAELADHIKEVGFKYATLSGITLAVGDIGEQKVMERRESLLAQADAQVEDILKQYSWGLITDEERYNQAIEIWTKTRDDMVEAVEESLDPFGSVYIMTTSGAKGNVQQLTQMAAMRGLMAAPSGKIIELPIRSSFREGLTVLEYFISTHGARKGLADTAIKTADSGYLTRRLIDCAQDVLIQGEDCGTVDAIEIEATATSIVPFREKITGRCAAEDIVDPQTREVIVTSNEEIDEEKAAQIEAAGIVRVKVRSPLTCLARRGLCRLCYGWSMATRKLVESGEAVGIIAAESIGEPGTQLTMRTFHTGGVAGLDITSGLPRVEELFEARVPRSPAIISEIDGLAEIIRTEDTHKIRVTSSEIYPYEHIIPEGYEVLVGDGQMVTAGTVLARKGEDEMKATVAGPVALEDGKVSIYYEEREEREYELLPDARLRVENDRRVVAGEFLTEGPANPQDILRIRGHVAVQQYIEEEIQKVYRSQGVNIHDKHIEVIIRQLLKKVRVETSGDTDLLPGDLVDRFVFEDVNAKVLAEGGEPATAQPQLLGVTKASLNTDSFLAAASFQETTRVLTEAAIQGMVDRLVGLKENVIIGKLIPAGTGLKAEKELPLPPAMIEAE